MLLWGARLMSWELPGYSWSGSSDSSVWIDVLFHCLGSELCCGEADNEKSVTLVEGSPACHSNLDPNPSSFLLRHYRG